MNVQRERSVVVVEINQEKCVKCLKCIKVCPFTVLENKNGIVQRKEGKGCLKCMHCGATCSENAITYNGKPMIEEATCQPSSNFSEELERFIKSRRSYRNFQPKAVDREIIEKAIDISSWAPSAKNQHPAKWIVIDDKNVIDKIMGEIVSYSKATGTSPEIVSELEEENNNVVMGNAHTLILCYGNDKAINAPADTAIAMTTVELVLQAEGIGTCWGGYLTRACNNIPEVKALIPEIPAGNSFYGTFMVGYPLNEEYKFVPRRVKRGDVKFV